MFNNSYLESFFAFKFQSKLLCTTLISVLLQLLQFLTTINVVMLVLYLCGKIRIFSGGFCIVPDPNSQSYGACLEPKKSNPIFEIILRVQNYLFDIHEVTKEDSTFEVLT